MTQEKERKAKLEKILFDESNVDLMIPMIEALYLTPSKESEPDGKNCEICGKPINNNQSDWSKWGVQTFKNNYHRSCIDLMVLTKQEKNKEEDAFHCEHEGCERQCEKCRSIEDSATAAIINQDELKESEPKTDEDEKIFKAARIMSNVGETYTYKDYAEWRKDHPIKDFGDKQGSETDTGTGKTRDEIETAANLHRGLVDLFSKSIAYYSFINGIQWYRNRLGSNNREITDLTELGKIADTYFDQATDIFTLESGDKAFCIEREDFIRSMIEFKLGNRLEEKTKQ